MATRQQQAKKMTAQRVKKAQTKIQNCVHGLFSSDYQKAKGWNVSKIAKDSGVSRNTVYKYINQMFISV